jgi:Methyltransferase domain
VLYRDLPVRHIRSPGTGLFATALPSRYPARRGVSGMGGTDRVLWLQGQCAGQMCPVCADQGPHRIVLSVPSTIAPDQLITFVLCRRCDCKFVTDFQPPAYDATLVDDASLRFYVEQGAGLELFARAVFVASRRPVRTYLDIGCGFGFGPDMATRIFGWDALGLDPGPLAAAGRDILGVKIESDILTIEKRLPGAPYDVIVATEVIEHVVNPHDLLQAMSSNLAEAGTLILTTPDGRYLDEYPDGDMLLPILSPGSHAVLYTAEVLSGVLKKAGFQAVAIIQMGSTLFAVASRSGPLAYGAGGINRPEYAGYLQSRFRDSESGSPVHVGIGNRLLAFLVGSQAYSPALAVFSELTGAIGTRLATDLTRPLDIAEGFLEQSMSFAEIPGKYPFCLPGLLYQRGLIAVGYERRNDLASSYFFAAGLAARAFLRSLNDIGISDGQLALLPKLTTDALRCLL